MMEKLLEQGCDANQKNGKEELPLDLAWQDADMSKILIKFGAKRDTNKKVTASDLFQMVSEPYDLVALDNVDPNSQQNEWALLMLAARKNWVNVTRYLIDKKVKLDDSGQSGKTALIIAVDHGNLPIVTILLESGASVDMVDNDGNTALMHAAKKEYNIKIIKELLKYNASLKKVNKKEETAFDVAARYRCEALADILSY